MTALRSFALAAAQGSVVATLHFAVLCLTESWTLAIEKLVYLVSSYSLMFYIFILGWSTYRHVSGLPQDNPWLARFSSVLQQYLHIVDFEVINTVHTVAPWLFTVWLSIWCMMVKQLGIQHIFTLVISTRPSTFFQIWKGAISFFAQPHVMRLIERAATLVLGIWVLITHMTSSPQSDDNHQTVVPPKIRLVRARRHGSDQEGHIYWLLKEIVANCDKHWQKTNDKRCKLEKGAKQDQIEKLEGHLGVELPEDYRVFLQLTNGLQNVLDGCGKPPVTIVSTTDIDHWMKDEILAPDIDTMDLWNRYLVDALFGAGVHRELLGMTKQPYVRHELKFICIAYDDKGTSGLYLVHPDGFRKLARWWYPVGHENEARNGSVIGRIIAHEGSYFGRSGHSLDRLCDRLDWTILQVHSRHIRTTPCCIYPSFTAYLQTLAELTRRDTVSLMIPSIRQECFEYLCRWKWEAEWTGTRIYATSDAAAEADVEDVDDDGDEADVRDVDYDEDGASLDIDAGSDVAGNDVHDYDGYPGDDYGY